ncbi:hypothetical protein [Exiguobacterium sp. s56]|uniref:hypothetical protein n=1 Tax=Exiguobacterium sp. s56 TaxID=2751232 RepID=UPI001BE5C780|nr:hypothetical protein [Exiguobacterium sp. s56]
MRKVFASSLCASMLIIGGVFINPDETQASSSKSTSSVSNLELIDLNNLEDLEKTGNVTVEEVTYDQFVTETAEQKGLSKEEVKRIHPNRSKLSGTTPSSFSTRSSLVSTQAVSSNVNRMHRVTITQNVGISYKPSVQIFIWTYSSGSFVQYKYIEDVGIIQPSQTNSKKFEGVVKAKITGTTSVWWMINGDFYDHGSTTVTVGGQGPVAVKGKTVTANFSIANSNTFYRAWDNSGTK